MVTNPDKKSPAELLAYQTELLEKITIMQAKTLDQQHKIAEVQITWLKSIDDRANKQLALLKSINSVATLFGILLILSILGAICTWFSSGF